MNGSCTVTLQVNKSSHTITLIKSTTTIGTVQCTKIKKIINFINCTQKLKLDWILKYFNTATTKNKYFKTTQNKKNAQSKT